MSCPKYVLLHKMYILTDGVRTTIILRKPNDSFISPKLADYGDSLVYCIPTKRKSHR